MVGNTVGFYSNGGELSQYCFRPQTKSFGKSFVGSGHNDFHGDRGCSTFLTAGLATKKFPVLTLNHILLPGVLAIVNTAFAFILWNKVLQRLEALEASVINNLAAFQIAVLAWVFLGEKLSGLDIIGITLTVIGAMLVQIGPNQQTGT